MHPLVIWGAAVGLLAWIFKEDPIVAAVQKYFEEFHDIIKLDEDDEKKKLREKRETLLGELKKKLPNVVPAFVAFNQGSYSMHTGTVPLDGNFDIDVGLVFDCKRDKYQDPVELKKLVRVALTNGNRTVNIRRPCVTVTYFKDEVPQYHVDLVVYVKRDDDKLDLAKGKEHSDVSLRAWEIADPKELTKLISNRFTVDEDSAQYRRCIRYLKRWRDFQVGSNSGLLSIALTVAAYLWFQPNKALFSGKPLDLKALRALVTTMLSSFQNITTAEATFDRLKVMLPVVPNNDLMAEMTHKQMDAFKLKLENLRDALDAAELEVLPEEACKILAKQFGTDFPVPPKDDTGKSVKAPYVTTGNSA